MSWEWSGAVGLALISLVVTLMLFPFVERHHYLASRPALFVGGVVFMPLFVAIAVIMTAGWSPAATAVALIVLMVGFWAAAAWLVYPSTHGTYVEGLDFGPGLNFRPDMILPGGVMLVKGVILTGVGLMLAVQESFRLPQWNWWGFVVAFFGIITLIPVRGVVKMVARRARFLGGNPSWQIPARWALLMVGMAVLLYGFLAAFMGRTPIVEFRPRSDLAWLTAMLLTAAGLSLAGREWWKTRLPEGVETTRARVASQLWLYASLLLYMYGAVVLFMGRLVYLHPADNPAGLALGALLFALGAVLVVGFGPIALSHELQGMVRIMVGALAAMTPEARWNLMMNRMRTMATYPAVQCSWHVGQMLEALDTLTPSQAASVAGTRGEVMMSLSSHDRRALMEAMDSLVA